jgi:large subunit ribosomal protein L3
MSEQINEASALEATASPTKVESITLNGLFAFKLGMTQVVDGQGQMVPCTVLKYEPWLVSQVKTQEKDGYLAVQIACRSRKEIRSPKSQTGALKAAGFKTGAYFVREIRGELPEGAAPGVPVAITSLKKGDMVNVTSVSKGKGFAGSVKRWNVGGGPASHGSCFHRQPGSSGNRTWPGRIMKGKHFPGHLGDETTTVKNLHIVDVFSEDSVIIVSGAIPGGENALVSVMKHNSK